MSLTAAEVVELVSSDGLVAAELLVLDSVLRWWRHNSSGGGDGDQATLEQLLGRVRWPLCPPSVLDTLDTEDTYQEVRLSTAYRAFREGWTRKFTAKQRDKMPLDGLSFMRRLSSVQYVHCPSSILQRIKLRHPEQPLVQKCPMQR